MAPKAGAMKRPAASSARASAMKRNRADLPSPEIAEKCFSIAMALKNHQGTPTSIREVLSFAVDHCLSVFKADRHEFAHLYVEQIGKTLEEIKVSMEEDKDKYQSLVEGGDAMKAEREAAKQEAESALEKFKAARDEAKSQAWDDAQAVKELKSAFNMARKPKEGNSAVDKFESNKVALQAALKQAFFPQQGSIGNDNVVEALENVGKEYGLNTSMLNGARDVLQGQEKVFGKAVVSQMDDVFNKKIADIATELLLSAAELKATASKEAFHEATAAQVEAEKDLISKAQAVVNFLPDFKKVADKLDAATAAYAAFMSGPMSAFSELKDLAPPPKEPEGVPEAVPETPIETQATVSKDVELPVSHSQQATTPLSPSQGYPIH
mmetsp:Transcript_156860/g.278286  ORF Transcript_156860/g.278286 Transcript_156860/m.278286 type:complete len:381 (-) Transcript_156860:41-1183(-)